jgi:MoaA/NifB/PqqE/SkfB family radical SAM enzyme
MTRLRVLQPETSPAPPSVALVSLTTNCNAACSFCCVGDILNKPELNPPDEKIREVMTSSRARGCTTLSFTGGEPTVHPKFAQFCREGRELGYSAITINTRPG